MESLDIHKTRIKSALKMTVACHICKSGKIINLPGSLQYYYCQSCHTAWLKKLPKTKYTQKYYSGSSQVITRLFKPVTRFFYYLRLGYLGFSKKNVWIDVGAGTGEFLGMVSANRKIGVEISATGRNIMRKNDIETLTPEDYLKSTNLNANVISFWHMLEHVTQPWDFLQVAVKNLAPRGKIIIGVPNIDSIEFKLFGNNWFHLAPEYHLWQFSPKSIKLLLNKSGFKIDRIDHWSPEHQPAGIIQSLINISSGTKNSLHNLVKRGVSPENHSLKNYFWILFWLTLGLPITILLWILESVAKKPGTFVIIASKI